MKVGILGAGLLGRLLGVALARDGHQVIMHDAKGPDADGAAARVAAAMLAPLAESVITEPSVVRMGLYSLARWPELLSSLVHPVFFQRDGTLILWHRQDSAQARLFGQRLTQAMGQVQPLVPSPLPRPQALDVQGLQALEPSLESRFQQGLYLPDEGQLDNRALLDGLRRELEDLQVGLHWHSPQDVTSLREHHGALDAVLDTRGMGAQPSLPQLRGVRGEVVRVHAPQVHLRRPTRLLHPRYPIYIAPKPDGVFVIGATEIETEDLSPASVRSCMELMSAAYAVHPGFGEARILEIGVQARPTLPDNLPQIDVLQDGVWRINGLYRHGYLIAPAVVDATLAWVLKGSPDLAQQWQLCQ